MASRALEEMGAKVVEVAANQRGSRPLERLVRRAGPEAFNDVFRTLLGSFPDLASNQYASHVLEAALASWAERLGGPESGRPAAEPLQELCASLREDQGWASLAANACASHAVRALVLALGGYSPDSKGRDKVAARSGLLPERRSECPPAVVSCRHSMAGALVQSLREDRSLCLNAHASPVAQLLLRVLRACGDRVLLRDAIAAILALEKGDAPGTECTQACDSLLRSAPGSRTLEAVLETCTPDLASSLFMSYFRTRLGGLVSGDAGDFGPFLVQRVLDNLREEPQLQQALAAVDFGVCLGPEATPPQQAIAAKMLEACLRLRACLKEGAVGIFRALGIRDAKNFPRAWPTVLALEALESPKELLKAPDKPRRNPTSEAVADESTSMTPPVSRLRELPAAGPQLLGMMLRLPSELVQPLNSGLARLLEHKDVLSAMARGTKTAKVLEAALAPSSGVLPNNRAKLAKSFKGLLGGLGPHPVGGWVCAALWRASLGDTALREAFAKELLAVEESLRVHNFAVWKVCGLHQAKAKQEDWSKQQQKAGKAKRLFDTILEGGDAEAAKAAAAARAREEEEKAESRAAVLADPLVAGLLPTFDAADADDDADDLEDVTRQKGAKAGAADTVRDASAVELDAILFQKRRRTAAAVKEAPAAAADAAAAAPARAVDAELSSVFELIKGKAPARLRRKRNKAAAKAAPSPGAGADDSSSE